MSASSSPQLVGRQYDEKHVGTDHGKEMPAAQFDDDASLGSSREEEVLSLQSVDPALNAKMHLVNNAS